MPGREDSHPLKNAIRTGSTHDFALRRFAASGAANCIASTVRTQALEAVEGPGGMLTIKLLRGLLYRQQTTHRSVCLVRPGQQDQRDAGSRQPKRQRPQGQVHGPGDADGREC